MPWYKPIGRDSGLEWVQPEDLDRLLLSAMGIAVARADQKRDPGRETAGTA